MRMGLASLGPPYFPQQKRIRSISGFFGIFVAELLGTGSLTQKSLRTPVESR